MLLCRRNHLNIKDKYFRGTDLWPVPSPKRDLQIKVALFLLSIYHSKKACSILQINLFAWSIDKLYAVTLHFVFPFSKPSENDNASKTVFSIPLLDFYQCLLKLTVTLLNLEFIASHNNFVTPTTVLKVWCQNNMHIFLNLVSAKT